MGREPTACRERYEALSSLAPPYGVTGLERSEKQSPDPLRRPVLSLPQEGGFLRRNVELALRSLPLLNADTVECQRLFSRIEARDIHLLVAIGSGFAHRALLEMRRFNTWNASVLEIHPSARHADLIIGTAHPSECASWRRRPNLFFGLRINEHLLINVGDYL